VVNGSVLMEGKKMSKSFGNIIPLRSAVRQYGADPLRMAILATSELLQDADMSLGLIRTFRERLERLYDSVAWAAEKHSSGTKMSDLKVEDRWLLSRVQRLVEDATRSIEKLRVREAIQTVVYTADQDVQWYLRRSRSGSDSSREQVMADVLYQVAAVRVRLVAPFAPFVSEEMWALLGNNEFVSTAAWPRPNPALIDVIAEEGEDLVRSLLEDTLNIIRVTKIKPAKVVYYTAAGWKLRVYLAALRLAEQGSLNVGQLMKQMMSDEELKKHAKEVSSFAKKMVEDVLTVPSEMRRRRLAIDTLSEQDLLEETKEFFKHEFGAEVSVYSEEDQNRYDPKGRAVLSKPYRPAIYVE
jgi:leucyl-tRNA synthetase